MTDWNPHIERLIIAIKEYNKTQPTKFSWSFSNSLLIQAIEEENIEQFDSYVSAIEQTNKQNAPIPQDTDTDITV